VTTDAFLADCRARLAFDLLSNTWSAVVLWACATVPGARENCASE
jgi:DNA-binding HxlR family transcriptional regulator